MAEGNDFWGPPTWKFLHSIAATYTPDQANAVKCLYQSLTVLLPCPKCRTNLKKKLKAFPIEKYLGSRDDFFFWTYLIHDNVNQWAGKTSPTLDDVREEYYVALLNAGCAECGE